MRVKRKRVCSRVSDGGKSERYPREREQEGTARTKRRTLCRTRGATLGQFRGRLATPLGYSQTLLEEVLVFSYVRVGCFPRAAACLVAQAQLLPKVQRNLLSAGHRESARVLCELLVECLTLTRISVLFCVKASLICLPSRTRGSAKLFNGTPPKDSRWVDDDHDHGFVVGDRASHHEEPPHTLPGRLKKQQQQRRQQQSTSS